MTNKDIIVELKKLKEHFEYRATNCYEEYKKLKNVMTTDNKFEISKSEYWKARAVAFDDSAKEVEYLLNEIGEE